MPSSMIHAVFMVAITAEKINIKCISLQYRLLRIPHESSLKALYFLDIACKVLSLIGVESRTYYIRRSIFTQKRCSIGKVSLSWYMYIMLFYLRHELDTCQLRYHLYLYLIAYM